MSAVLVEETTEQVTEELGQQVGQQVGQQAGGPEADRCADCAEPLRAEEEGLCRWCDDHRLRAPEWYLPEA